MVEDWLSADEGESVDDGQRSGELDELAAKADGYPAGGLAGCMWWATLLAGSQDVAATAAQHEKNSAWYAGRDATARVIDLLVEKGRIDTAIAFARLRLDAGDEWAIAWVPRLQAADRDQVSEIQYFLTRRADAALPDLLSGEGSTKLWIADVDYAAYGDLRVRQVEAGAEIALACWHVYIDTARYFGDNPPNDAETELRPAGTAITELGLTVAIVNDLAARWNALDVPRPHANGSHLAITVPLPTT
ncbi:MULTISPECIES: hypothetical protein [unclassified Kribbella]|uniref:hypothetical protein n=1 Tax=unclassified Kribbella TaxID=2644121 RepID=UPI00301A06C7